MVVYFLALLLAFISHFIIHKIDIISIQGNLKFKHSTTRCVRCLK